MKPRIRWLTLCRWWACESAEAVGHGLTPRAAYADWLRGMRVHRRWLAAWGPVL